MIKDFRKRVFAILTCLCVMLSMVCVPFDIAKAEVYGGGPLVGSEGGTVFWDLDSDTGILRIYGSGSTGDTDARGFNSGYSAAQYARTIVIEGGISIVGKNAFYYPRNNYGVNMYSNVTQAKICDGVRKIDSFSFMIPTLTDIYFYSDRTYVEENAITKTATIHCYEGSFAQDYAEENDMKYELMCREHETETVNVVEATCLEEGYSGDLVCTVCGECVEEGSVVPALGHDYQTVNASKATCNTEGYTGDEICSMCGECKSIGSTIEAIGHDWTAWSITKPASCTSVGEAMRICNRCNEVDKLPIEKSEHDYTISVVEPTCEKDGYTLHKCSICGHTYKNNTVKATGHSYRVTIIKPTCTSSGYTRHTCSSCDYSYKSNTVKAKGHSFGTNLMTCKVCGVKNPNYIAKVTSLKVTNKATRKAVISWTKATGAKGYQVKYSKSSSFSSAVTKSTTSLKYTASSLAKGKKYYVKVRAYRTVNGKKKYGSWSDTKKVTIKK